MEDLDLKTKDELIAEIKLLKSKIDNSGLYFPGLGVINKYEKARLVEVEELSETLRGEGGFGHTGKH